MSRAKTTPTKAKKTSAKTAPAARRAAAPASPRVAPRVPSAPPPSSRAPGPSSLASLEAERYARPIDLPVVDLVHESRELEAVLDELGERLLANSRLDPALARSLRARRRALEEAEQQWLAHRLTRSPSEHKETLHHAEQLKKDLLAALRYFLHDDVGVQTRVDAIVPGTGLADLIDDLEKLAVLAREQAAALRRADLPPDAAARAERFARELSTDSTASSSDEQGEGLFDLRNRAFWWLREALDEIRAAGRYVFRNDPRRLPLFRVSSARARTSL